MYSSGQGGYRETRFCYFLTFAQSCFGSESLVTTVRLSCSSQTIHFNRRQSWTTGKHSQTTPTLPGRNLLGKCSSLNKESSTISEYRSDFISLSLSCPQFLTQFVFTGNSQIWGCLLSSLHRCHSHCLLCLQPFLWRTQRSVSLICVDLWPSTVSAGDVTHSLVPQFVELLFLFPLVI